MQDAKVERNREVYEDRLSGMSIAKLSEKYGVTGQCIKTIIEREERKERLRDYRWYQILEEVADCEEMVTRTVHVLERSGYDSEEAIMSVTRNELLRCRNCGEAMIKLIFRIADILRKNNQ